MRRFDCLSPMASIEGPCLLEASAGTGKTFAVEHIIVRLLLEKKLPIEDILVITFTRAATRELKERIRSNIEKAIEQLQTELFSWEYLQVVPDRKIAIQILHGALGVFDQNSIFTIHGFCHRMLREFAFEAKRPVGSKSSNEPRIQVSKKLQQAVIDFLASLSEDVICVEQLSLLLKKTKGVERLAKQLLRESMKSLQAGSTFELLYEKYAAMVRTWDLSIEQILEDFRVMAKQQKTQVKGRFEEQIRALFEAPTRKNFRFLLGEQGSLWEFLSPQNRKVKYTPLSLASESFFSWTEKTICPLIEQATDPKQLFHTLAYKWSLSAKKIMLQEELVDPDGILQIMHEKMKNCLFVELVQKKYAAAIIDEFQDTDSLQWDIFHRIFLSSGKPIFLVGDPKQSIYRFRKADIYTYLEAKNCLPSSCHYFLDTNFRSSPALLKALNTLFARDWLPLPKIGSFLPYRPVLPGLRDVQPFSDERGALHFFVAETSNFQGKNSRHGVLESIFCPFIVEEIIHLQKEIRSLSDIAILVKDRYQAQLIVDYLQQRGLPASTKSHLPLGETFAFQVLYELLHALIDPTDRSRARLVLAGPLGRMQLEQIPLETPTVFFMLKEVLEERGLACFFQRLFSSTFYEKTVLEAIASEDAAFYEDFFHAVELLLQWEREEGFSLEGLSRMLQNILWSGIEEDERVRRRPPSDDEAIQVMTMHVSKGLEFDVVFAVGLAAQTPKSTEEAEEFEAEKMRQLYVAMTRAKRRLYVPVLPSNQPLDREEQSSPIELFLHPVLKERSLEVALQELGTQASITWNLVTPQVKESVFLNRPSFSFPPFVLGRYEVEPRYIHSFTSLAQRLHSTSSITPSSTSKQEEKTIHTLPKGADMGVLLHELLEDLFSSSYPIWRFEKEARALIARKMKESVFLEWIEVIQDLLIKTVALPFLAELEPEDVRVEVEFLFEGSPHFVKGFVDLLFRRGNQLYLVDWKSNWLGSSDEEYTLYSLEQSMKEHDYFLQATLYAEAVERSFPTLEFAGAYYIFLRGISSETQGVFFFKPRRSDAIFT